MAEPLGAGTVGQREILVVYLVVRILRDYLLARPHKFSRVAADSCQWREAELNTIELAPAQAPSRHEAGRIPRIEGHVVPATIETVVA